MTPASRRGLTAFLSTLLVILAVTLVVVSGLWDDVLPVQTGEAGRPSGVPASTGGDPQPAPNAEPVDRVVVVSIDGLASYALTRRATPVLTALLEDGAGTTNARTVERTVTLPNHTSMVTGRPVLKALGGHGVEWNDDQAGTTVLPGVESVFSTLSTADRDSAVFAGKQKFDLWERSWPGTVDRFTVIADLPDLVEAATKDLRTRERDLTFVHLSAPDVAGHRDGWGSPSYYSAVREADLALGRIVEAIGGTRTVVIVTADHGGIRGTRGHAGYRHADSYTIPFVVWGAGVARGDLYQLNDDYADPGTDQPMYDATPAVRNAAVANLVTDLLGLGPVPGSSINADQDLDVLASAVTAH